MASNITVSAWDNAEELAGLDLIKKEELEGKPFVITGFMFRTNAERNIRYLQLDIEFRDGATATFEDSSTSGVKKQFEEYLADKGIEYSEGEIVDLPKGIMCSKGLRASTYPKMDARTGKERMVTTHYLTTSGRRA